MQRKVNTVLPKNPSKPNEWIYTQNDGLEEKVDSFSKKWWAIFAIYVEKFLGCSSERIMQQTPSKKTDFATSSSRIDQKGCSNDHLNNKTTWQVLNPHPVAHLLVI